MGRARKPKILTRSEWGAIPAQGVSTYGSSLPALQKVYDRITVHHDAEVAAKSMTQDQAIERMQRHQDMHINTNGWADIGYHYVISPRGLILAGRSLFSPGSHVAKANTGNLGICLMGNFESQTPPVAQIQSLVELAAWWCYQLKIDPSNISGHRDFLPTACPGATLYSELDEIRRQVTKLVNDYRTGIEE